ncbi:MAG TPA: hypothetical protein V6C89_01630 [Drouetiella sp.]|jgi:hypothetical protein
MLNISNVVYLIADAKERIDRGYSAEEILLEEMAPRGISRITTCCDSEVLPGQSARMRAADGGYDFTVTLTGDGLALLRSHLKGFFLHGGEASCMGHFGYDNLSRFEQMRRIIPLKPDKDVPLGIEGDWVFKPLPNNSVTPLRVERIPSLHNTVKLSIKPTLLYTVRELTRQSGLLSSKHLSWYVKLAEAINVITS